MREKQSILEIDQYSLDSELAGQAKLFGQYADMLAQAEDRLNRLTDNFELVKAQVAHRIRTKPSKYGLSKVTDPSVKEAVIRHRDYQDALRNIADSKLEVDSLKGVVRALEHRKRALEKLVDLRLADYYSEPRPSKNGTKNFASRNVRKGLLRESREEDDGD